MTQRDLARLLVKFAAIVIFATAFTALPEWLMQELRSPDRPAALKLIWMAFAPASVSMLAGLAMYWWAEPLVEGTLVGKNPVGAPADMDLRAFEEIALTVLGVYFLTSGLAEGLYYWGNGTVLKALSS
jgi:dipeptide/tripeptide permease